MSSRALRLWLALWRRAAPVSSVRPLGLKLRPTASDAAMRALEAWKPSWKTHAIAAILGRREGAFIDVGANVGQSLLDFLSARRRSTYVGFEPNLACATHLSDLIASNRLESCTIVAAAISDENAIVDLYSYGGEVDSGATTRQSLRPRLDTVAARSPALRMDDLRALPEEIALIKIDVEGSELEALRGMEQTLTSKQPWLLCEVLHRDPSADPREYRARIAELSAFLARIGYEPLRIVEDRGGTSISALEPVTSFPDVAWHDGSQTECDYLLVPAAQAAEAREVLAR